MRDSIIACAERGPGLRFGFSAHAKVSRDSSCRRAFQPDGGVQAAAAARPAALLEHGIQALLQSGGISEVIMVTGHRADEIRAALPPSPGRLRLVFNANFIEGEMLSSVQTGIAAALRLMPRDSFSPLPTSQRWRRRRFMHLCNASGRMSRR